MPITMQECAECGHETPSNDLCGNGRCANCCDDHCYSCGCDAHVTASNWCGNCDACHNCCECSNSDEVAQPRGTTVFGTYHRMVDPLFFAHRCRKSEPLVGIEAEICTAQPAYATTPLQSSIQRWGMGCVHDGSLPSSGFELQLPAANGKLLESMLAQLNDALTAQRATVDHRAGLHVHVDGRDWGWYDARRLMLLWGIVEPEVMLGMPRSRRTSNFCVPVSDRYIEAITPNTPRRTSKAEVFRGIYSDSVRMRLSNGAISRDHYNSARYVTLNMHSWVSRKTFEFRMHHGTTDGLTMRNWAQFCGKLVQFAYKTGETKLIQARDAAAANPAWIRKEVIKQAVGGQLNDWWEARRSLLSAHPLWESGKSIAASTVGLL